MHVVKIIVPNFGRLLRCCEAFESKRSFCDPLYFNENETKGRTQLAIGTKVVSYKHDNTCRYLTLGRNCF